MNWAHPYFWLLLLVLPLAAWLRGKRGRPPAFVYSSTQLVRGILNITKSHSGGFLSALRWLTLALCIGGLTQLQRTRSETKVTASGVDIVVAIDMSGSMQSEDFQINGQPANRLEKAKDVLKKFIEKRPSDRIGLVAFATQAYIAAPMTLDHDFLAQNLDRLEIGTIDESQTAIGSGLSTAINRLRDLKSKSKIVILMTDGQNNAGKIEPMTAAEAAQALNVKVYTIGVGIRGMGKVPMFIGGRKVGYRPQPVDIDEDTLQKIADMTKGKYYRADNSEKFDSIYAEIDKLEKTEAEVKKFAHVQELFPWFVTPALVLLLLEVILRHTAFRRLP